MGAPNRKAVVRLFNAAFFRKVIARHDTGMGESYMEGDYEVRNFVFLAADTHAKPCISFTSRIDKLTRYRAHLLCLSCHPSALLSFMYLQTCLLISLKSNSRALR